jgi:spermidine/putrescine transport system permease protein
LKKFFQHGYVALIFLFLYAPIVVLILFSFNDSKSRIIWNGFTLDWYRQLFQNDIIMNAFWTTLLVAAVSAIASTIIGTVAALGIHSMPKLSKNIFLTVNNIPMTTSDTIMGMSFMLLFFYVGISKGMMTLLLAHITFCTPYVVLSVMPRLRQLDKNIYEAAMDLGATPFMTIKKVILPEIMPSIITGAIMAFTISIDDFVVSYFTAGKNSQTLAVVIYSMIRRKISPEINAVSTIMFVCVLVLLIIVNLRQIRELKKNKQPRRL